MARISSSSTKPKTSLSTRVYKKAQALDSHIDNVTKSLHLVRIAKYVPLHTRFMKQGMSALIIVLLISYSFSPYLLKANTVSFYPSSCLGGWVDPANATGKPNDSGVYTASHSAVLPGNTHAEMYCGSFDGDVPLGTVPQKTDLIIHWQTREARAAQIDLDGKATTTIISDSFASSTQSILDAEGDTVIFTATTTPENTATEDIKEEEKPKEDVKEEKKTATEEVKPTEETKTDAVLEAAPPTPEPTEEAQPEKPLSLHPFLQDIFSPFFVQVAHAEEESVPPEAVESTVPVVIQQEEVVTPVQETPTSTDQTKDIVPETGGDQPAQEESVQQPATEEVAAPPEVITTEDGQIIMPAPVEVKPEVVVEEKQPPFIEVLYTFDGVDWKSAGMFTPGDINDKSISIPYDQGATWTNLKSLQVKIKSLQTLDEVPTLYVDALEFQIEHKRKHDTRVESDQAAKDIEVDEETGRKVLLFGDEELKRIKGITPYLALVDVTRTKGDQVEDDLWLYDIESDKRLVVATGTQIAADFPFGLKGDYVFWLSRDKKQVYAFDSKHRTYQSKEVPPFSISDGERGEVTFEDVPWTVIIGADNFVFWSEATGEVFGDEDAGALVNYTDFFHLNTVLTEKEKENIGIPVDN